MRRFCACFLAAALLIPVSSFADDKEKNPDEIGNRDVGKGVNFYSLEKEIAIGKQLAQEVERQAKLVDDPIVAEYVNRVGQNLVRNSDAKVPFTIKVLDTEEVNAFALPGGFFFVNSGLILKADNEAELAGVMARSGEARHQAGHARRDRADRHDCRLDRDSLWLDRLRHPAGRGAGHSHGILEFLSRVRVRGGHAGSPIHV
jgi:predicted Zn-dependent protease